MFERFTDAARAVVVASQEAARELQHDYIGTEHFLLGLLARPDTVAARALAGLGVSSDDVRRAVIDRVGMGSAPASGHIPFTPRMKSTLEHSLSEAAALQHPYIGTEHLLLGLLGEPDGLGAQILAEEAGNLSKVRAAVLSKLSGEAPADGELGPAELGRRTMLMRIAGDRITLDVTDPALVELAHEAVAALGDRLAEPGVISGDLPVAAGLAAVWQTLRNTLGDIRRHGSAQPPHQ
ncbi:Clp protease N-terminal domain-containing protein [uncultured Mycobacterium sp.]|uniref:Clp protease N-terminal domain-containing protein n=1 Tax=uncultured Mycobacterium sp. TaxID=171292 RepID=UPI0035CBD9EB